MGCDADCLLADRSIDYKQNLLRLQKLLQLFEFLNQRFIDFLPARRVENVDVSSVWLTPFKCSGGDALNIPLIRIGSVNRDFNLLSQRRELPNRGRPLQIARNQSRRVTLFLQKTRQLSGRSRLAGTVESYDQNARRFFEIEWRSVASKERSQLIMEDFHDLLARRDAAKDSFPERLSPHPANEFLRDLKINISLK